MIHSSVFQAKGRWEGLLGAPLCGVGLLPGMLPSPCGCCSQSGERWAAEGRVPAYPLHPTLLPAMAQPGTAQLLTLSLPPSTSHPGLGILTKHGIVQSEIGESRAAVPGSRGGGSRVVGTGLMVPGSPWDSRTLYWDWWPPRDGWHRDQWPPRDR